jgi:hypothetical protein
MLLLIEGDLSWAEGVSQQLRGARWKKNVYIFMSLL